MDKEFYEITPDINMVRDWARTGYEYPQAVFEIFDNALDAIRETYNNTLTLGEDFEGGSIRVHWDYEGDFLVITDNGCGIEPESIPAALVAGSSKKSGLSNLTGVFGVGLKKAAMALAHELEIISRTTEKSEFYSVKFSQQILTDHGGWKVRPEQISLETSQQMKEFLPESHGTVILLRNLNRELMPFKTDKKSSIRAFREKVSEVLKIGTRHIVHEASQLGCFLPITIKVQTQMLEPVDKTKTLFDPLECQTGAHDTKFYLGGPNGEFEEITSQDGDFKCLIRCSHTRDVKASRGDLGVGIPGAYKKAVRWVRSGREICLDRNSPLIESKDLADFYVEIVIDDDGVSDTSPYRVDSAKKSMTVSAEALEFLNSVLAPFVKASKTRGEEKKVSRTTNDKASLVEQAMTVSHKTDRKKTDDSKVIDIDRNKNSVTEKTKRVNKTYVGHDGGKTTIRKEDKFGIKSDFEFIVVKEPHCDLAFREADPDENNPRTTTILLNDNHPWVSFCLRKEENALQLHVVAGSFICAFRDHDDVIERIRIFSNELKSISESVEKLAVQEKKSA